MSSAMTHPVDQISAISTRHTTHTTTLTNVSGVVGSSENELGGSVVPRANVADVWFAGDENLSRTEIAQFEDSSSRVE